MIDLFELTLVKQSEDIYKETNMDPRCAIKTYYEGLNIAGSNRIHYIEFKIDKVLPKQKDEMLKEIIAQFEVTETHDAKRERGMNKMAE